MRMLILALVALSVSGCVGSKSKQMEQARRHSEQVAVQVVAKEFPSVRVRPVAECVTASATDEEITTMLQARLQGVSGRTAQLVLSILRRPETRTCVAASGVDLPI